MSRLGNFVSLIRLAATFFLVISLPVVALAEFNVPHIRVVGTAETQVVPDEMLWAVSVKTLGGSVENVSVNHANEVAVVLGYLKQAGVEPDGIKSSRMQLKENWVYRNKSRLQDGYYALTELNFKTTDFESYLNHWKQLATFNNVSINNVRFDISNRIEIQNQTRVVAVKKARSKAKALAEAIDSNLLEPLLIEEVNGFSAAPRNAVMRMAEADVGGGDAIAPGKETVSASVNVVFRISTN